MWGRRLLGWCLALAAAVVGVLPAQAAEDAAWRAHDAQVQRRALVDLERLRRESREAAKAAAMAGRTAVELRAWADYLSHTHTFTPDETVLARQLIDRAAAAGESATRFDLMYALGHHTAFQRDATVAAQIDALQALADELGDPARQGIVAQLRGEQALNEGRGAEAIRQFTAALAVAPNVFRRVQLLHFRVNAAVNVNVNAGSQAARDAARQDLLAVVSALDLRAFPTLGLSTHASLGRLAFASGQQDEAIRELRLALSLAPPTAAGSMGVASTQMSLAEALLAAGQPTEAAEVMRQWRLTDEPNPAARFWRATLQVRILVRTGAADIPTSGAQWLSRAAEERALLVSEPRFVESYHSTAAEFYEHTGQLSRAVAALKAAQLASAERESKANERLRLEFQTQLDVAARERENAALRAEARLAAEQRLRWGWAFGASALAAAAIAAALAISLKRKRQLAVLSATLAQRNAQLEERSGSRIRLLAAACHDLRQPAHALGMLAELGADAVREPESMRAWLQNIRHCSATLTDMLGELMDLSRLDGGHYAPVMSVVSLDEILRDVRLQYGDTARLKGLAFAAPDCGLHVRSDRHLLRRIVFNLVSNAVKYAQVGRVTIQAGVVDGVVQLTVADTGPGIPSHRLEEVFQDFVRLEPLHAADGLGIGLSIVRRATELLGHGLTLASPPGAGTLASLSLGAAQQASASPKEVPAAGVEGAGRCVAILENDRSVREAMAGVLTRAGYRVASAGTLAALRAEADPRVVELLLVDLHLDHADGLDLVDEVRSWCGRSTLPVILVTGDLEPSVATRAARLNVVLAHKPLPPRRMLALVARLLGSAPQVVPVVSGQAP
jgi:signal transduction histidine kinase/CheY-like chemotaxis protein